MHAVVAVVFALLAQTPDVVTTPVAHDAGVTLDPAAGSIVLQDRFSVAGAARTITVQLHSGLSPTFEGATVVDTKQVDGVDIITLQLPTNPDGKKKAEVTLRAKGRIVHPPEQVATEHQRSFQETVGTIEARGVYLSPSSRWLPTVVDEHGVPLLVTGRVRVHGLPAGWRALSEGGFNERTQTWEHKTPVDGLHLIAGPFVVKKTTTRGVSVETWLRTTDGKPADDSDALSERYLEVTGQYLQLYGDLIGTYPYAKFALVENFWETGYGMPSFTLLGSQVVRFPFILHTSWPHELLHNWWGNGVFPQGGNWSEGLTAYLADHLNDERQGRGADHRRTTIQRYLDFVDTDVALDFPLAAFTNRFSAASEAIGYGKTMMMFHMLRRSLGDDVFKRGLQQVWKDHRFQRAGFADLAMSFSRVVPKGTLDVPAFFAAWTTTKGIPAIGIAEVGEATSARGTKSARITLTQSGPTLPMDVPVVVTTVDGRSVASVVRFDGITPRSSVNVPLPAGLGRVDVDPFFDVFRRLTPDEVPPSLSRAFGAKQMLFVTPTNAPKEEIAAWTAFAASVCPDAKRCTVVDDKTVQTLPADAAVFVLGAKNLLRAGVFAGSKGYDVRYDDRGFFGPGGWQRVMEAKDRKAAYDVERTAPETTALAVVVEHPRNRALAMTLVTAPSTAPSTATIPLLAKKLPHYGKYGAVGFAGEAAENSLKLQWTSSSSPLSRVFVTGTPLTAKAPKALAELPPPFDGEAMKAVVSTIVASTSKNDGRLGDGAEPTRVVIEAMLRGLGLGVERQCVPRAQAGRTTTCNLIATVPGTDATLPKVVVGAHLDHLRNEGRRRFPGADDNASGISVLLEVAKQLVKQKAPRTLEIVFFDGEEAGRVGSKHYVQQQAKGSVLAMVNLDTVGRVGDRPLLVIDGDSASEWVHIVRGVGFTTGVQATLAPQGGGASDQQSFLEVGIPAIQLFSGPNADYHQSTDTADKIEPSSLVAAAVMTREIVGYLRERPEPLTAKGASSSTAGVGVRRASLGSVPDMTFAGPGVRFEDVVAESPAAKAALMKGDVLVRFDGQAVDDLRRYSELLKQKTPGDVVKVVVRRGNSDVEATVTLGAR